MAELQRRAPNAYGGWFKQPVLADIARSESVTVVVGSGAASRRFYLHKNLVTSQSAFFTSCLISGWKGSNQNRVDLLHEDPTAFETVLAWLYRYSETFDSLRKSTNPFTAIIPIWCLADKLIMPRLKNDIMDEIQGIAKQRNIVAIPDDVLAVFTSAPMGDTRLGHFYMETFTPGQSRDAVCTTTIWLQSATVHEFAPIGLQNGRRTVKATFAGRQMAY
ncbi:hypothetical protein LTR70_008428 [Exophiala xenobiotica]|uniref:BTB domain-containing protein n=1 Tax=Lithohypha guttulata TaxID=1690604 RepID=A0ABR0KDM9_9EURO|nr:hypothetical protein LTR24_003802 [Lithohypha guttulata]KAK5312075.1 hypothetical protein LTR70_008428 [Exophiala xenobiotica]